MRTIDVVKLNEKGAETWRYQGQVLAERENEIILEAYFDRQDMTVQGLFLGKGDRFVEHYYRDRWYNIFEIHAREDDHIRGWYCNITRPAEWEGDRLSYVDLALDLLVFPDGQQAVLDADEFAALEIAPQTRAQARTALGELQAHFQAQLDA